MSSQVQEQEEKGKTVLPFQVQITYTALSGMKCLRVLTKTKEITQNFEEVEKDLDIAVLGMHANAYTANLAKQGNFGEAMNQQAGFGALIQKNVKTESERVNFGNWSAQQPTYSPQPSFGFGAQPQQPQANFFGAPPQPNQDIFAQAPNPFNFPPQPGYGAPQFGAPQPSQPQQPSFSFGMAPSSPNSAQPQQQPFGQPQNFEDDLANVNFQQRNVRQNKKQWGGSRKY